MFSVGRWRFAGWTVIEVGVPLEGLRALTVPAMMTGAGVRMRTTAAVAGVPVRTTATGSPTAKALTLTVTPF